MLELSCKGGAGVTAGGGGGRGEDHGRPGSGGTAALRSQRSCGCHLGPQERNRESTHEEGWRAGSKGLHMNRWTEQEAQERSPDGSRGWTLGLWWQLDTVPLPQGSPGRHGLPLPLQAQITNGASSLKPSGFFPACNDWFPLRRASPHQFCGNIITCFHGWGLRLIHTPKAGQGGDGGEGGREVVARLHLLRAWVGTSQADSSRFLSPSFCSHPSATPTPAPGASSPTPPFPVGPRLRPSPRGRGWGGSTWGAPG